MMAVGFKHWLEIVIFLLLLWIALHICLNLRLLAAPVAVVGVVDMDSNYEVDDPGSIPM